MTSRVIPVSPFSLVVFGATGDLARKKLFPALWRRLVAGQSPPDSCIIGVARRAMTDEEFRRLVAKAVTVADPTAVKNKKFNAWLAQLSYIAINAADEYDSSWDTLQSALAHSPRPCLYYLAVAPAIAEVLCRYLAGGGFLTEECRLVLEKPFGRDLASAGALNKALAAAARESDIYRIDHYLGKETVQNLMALRFANALWEPVWNAQAVDHVQITVAEDVGVEGRGDYYDRAGATRDMLQNHLLQLLCLTAMEPPAQYVADDVRDQKLKVLSSLRPLTAEELPALAVRGQYHKGNSRRSYLSDAGVDESNTETFIAVKCAIDNWRWAGTPFYLRTGKRLTARMSEIAICFKPPSHSVFPALPPFAGNTLAVRLQPQERITLHVNIKDPGPGGFRIADVPLDMSFAETLGVSLPDAYERLLMDIVRGDQTLFMRADELEAAWEWVTPLIDAAADQPPQPYVCGASGPDDALRLLHADGRKWRQIV